MAHHGHHGKSQHRQRDVPMPAMPGPRLGVIEPKLGLRRLERILDRPAMPLNRHPSFDPSSGWAPGREERELAIRDAAPDQDRKSTRLNSSHPSISYAVFCLKKKKTHHIINTDNT